MLRGVVELVSSGQAHSLLQQGRTVRTAIGKQPAPGAVMVTENGIPGDVQVDRKHHGGVYRALCVFPAEHYEFFERKLVRRIPRPAFGENLTTRGLTETDVCIGEIFTMGEARVQVTQPRGPCNTLSAFLGDKNVMAWANAEGYTGWYMSVLTPGKVQAGDAMVLESRPGTGMAVEQVNRARHPRSAEEAALAELVLAEPLLRDEWPGAVRRTRELLAKRG